MKIIGCDFHTRQQQIAMLDTDTGEMVERRWEHAKGEARKFYEALPKPVRVGIEATGYTQWFERLLAELGHELWVGDAAAMRALVVRQQKNDKRDAAHLLHLLVEERFPRIWMATPAERDLRQLVRHRVKLVQMRTEVQNQLQSEDSSGSRRRIGSISKQGNSLMRWLLVEAGQTAARRDAELRRLYQRLKFRRGSQIAKVAVARRLAVRLYGMLRAQADYGPLLAQRVRLRGSSGSAVTEEVAPSRG